jgi:hypothetical protein
MTKWITTGDFASLAPINVFGKEHTFSHDTSIIEPVETNAQKVNETELKELRETLSKTQTDWALSKFRVNDLSELTSDQCEQILSALERRKTQNE